MSPATAFPRRIRRLARRLRLGDSGVPLIEFALVLPVVVTLALGMAEVGIYALISLKLQNAASNLANLATRDSELSQAEVDDIFEAMRTSMEPFNIGENTSFVISSIGGDGEGGATVGWQRTGAGSLVAGSQLGRAGGAAALPASVSVSDNSVVAVEAFYSYSERLLGFLPTTTLYRVAYFRPRFGPLGEPQ